MKFECEKKLEENLKKKGEVLEMLAVCKRKCFKGMKALWNKEEFLNRRIPRTVWHFSAPGKVKVSTIFLHTLSISCFLPQLGEDSAQADLM